MKIPKQVADVCLAVASPTEPQPNALKKVSDTHQKLEAFLVRQRRARNLYLSALLEAVRDRTKTVDLKQINRVLLQAHWRKDVDLPQ
ncbi:MAG TPA: hypothetical protein PKA88_31180 [Polyangiaceae bacterium]|nr:hypothetical protein [Polyangiaceae bacterium]HMR78210.1 hypothetical protein [Polyangiaceae bacterium]